MKRDTRSDKIFYTISDLLLLLFLLMAAYPLYFVVIASVSSPNLVATGKVILFPKGITIAGYKKIIEYSPLWRGYGNTILYVVLQTILSVTVTTMAGYALSNKKLPGRRGITIYMTITMFFSGGLIPTYLWMDAIGLVGTPLTVILMGSVGAYNIFVARSFIQNTIPDALFEAASIDGCSQAKFFIAMVVPLSPALLAVLTLFVAVGQWNSWFNAMVYLRDNRQMPLQMVLRELIISQTALAQAGDAAVQGEDAVQQALLSESMKYAIIIVSTLPIMCLYPYVQKYFVKGIMVGSVKG